MKLTVSYDLSVEQVAAVIYAMADPNMNQYKGSIDSQDDIKKNLKKSYKNIGIEFGNYLADVSAPSTMDFEKAILHARQVFRKLGKRKALISELKEMNGDVKEIYEEGDPVIRIPGFLTSSGETDYKPLWPSRPSWLTQKEYNKFCYRLEKDT